jgi:transcriptional regulator with XRE-family HTH domain
MTILLNNNKDFVKTHTIKVVATKYSALLSYPYTHTGIQRLIRDILDTYGISQFELAKRAGLTPATIYQILKKSEKQVTRPPRKSSVQGLARAISAQVMFNSKTNKIFLQHASVPESKRDDIAQFMLQIADAIRQSGRTEIPRDERDKILRVLRVLL